MQSEHFKTVTRRKQFEINYNIDMPGNMTNKLGALNTSLNFKMKKGTNICDHTVNLEKKLMN